MKTQISRDAFKPEKCYSGVYLQQGRMITDADWNELTDIVNARLTDALRDVISGRGKEAGGAPRDGGLKISKENNNFFVDPGVLYVEGVPAKLLARSPLLKQPDYPIDVVNFDGKNLKVYADAWERTVTALEDLNLMDAALHGADTATRNQTMLQVKWCPDSIDPLDPEKNPSQGNSLLTLTLLENSSSSDSCDPCATQVSLTERIGNYLFRVEVHDYDTKTKKLTLKWSSDNGAETCLAREMPSNFKRGKGWPLECFVKETEQLLGRHFVESSKPLRGTICEEPFEVSEEKFVRQWDGYLAIDLEKKTVVAGCDQGASMVQGIDDATHGRVVLTDDGILIITLKRMKLKLLTKEKQFVPGDYWLAEVRESTSSSKKEGLLNDALPRGVRHHYLFLGKTDAEGNLIPQDDALRRRMSFPPLSDIRAEDIAYVSKCSTDRSIKNRLKLDDSDSVKQVLDALLCDLDAASLPLGSSNLCSALAHAKTVQDALKMLCKNLSASCATMVENSDQLQNLLTSGATDIWICLKGGSYTLNSLEIQCSSLRICGQGAESTKIECNGYLKIEANEVLLEKLCIYFNSEIEHRQNAHFYINADISKTVDCKIFRKSSELSAVPTPMIKVSGMKGGRSACKIIWSNNFLSAKRKSNSEEKFKNSDLKEDIKSIIEGIFSPQDESLKEFANKIASNTQELKRWKESLKQLLEFYNLPLDGWFYLKEENLQEHEVVNGLLNSLKLLLFEPSYALCLENALVGGCLVGNEIDGWLLFANNFENSFFDDAFLDMNSKFSIATSLQRGDLVMKSGEDLRLESNLITAIKTNFGQDLMSYNDQTHQVILNQQVYGYSRAFLVDNTLLETNNSMVAASFIGQGNIWNYRKKGALLGFVITDRATFVGNLLERYGGNITIASTARKEFLASTGNVFVDMIATVSI